MINLLTEKEKKNIENEYKFRLVIVGMGFMVGIIFSASIFLLPSYFLSATKVENAQAKVDALKKESDEKSKADLEAALADIKNKLALFVIPKNQNSISDDLIIPIEKVKTNNIKITGISYEVADKNNTGNIRGVATDRVSLINFSEALKNNPQFSNVDLPVSDLAKNKQIDFNILVTFKTS